MIVDMLLLSFVVVVVDAVVGFSLCKHEKDEADGSCLLQ